MAIKYPEDRARFISDLRAAGLPAGRASFLELAELLGFSVSHIKNLFYGVNRYGSRTKDKLDALIAAKANGPEPVEQFEVDLPARTLSPIPPPPPLTSKPVLPYDIVENAHGETVLVQIIATFMDPSAAYEICKRLNKEGG